MDKQSYSFRTSLYGFHRGDVVDFIGKLSTSHESELREREEEIRILREELAEAKASLEEAQAEIELLQSDVEPAEEAVPEPEPVPVPASLAASAEPADPGRELEAYRRAERYEREAKLRAEKICADASDAVRQAGIQMEDRQAKMYSATDALGADFEALQAAVSEMLGEMNDTRDRLARMERDLVAED